MLAGGRNNFSSSSAELLTQQTPPPPPAPCCPTSTNHARQRTPASFPCALAIPVCVWATERSDFNLALCRVLPLPQSHISRRGRCTNPAVPNLTLPLPLDPAGPSLDLSNSCPMGPCSNALLGTDTTRTSSLSPAALLFPLPLKHSHACQQLEHIRNGKERLMFHLNVARCLLSPKQLSGSSLPGQCSTAETPWCLADTSLFLQLDLCVF